jgi:hypothetical protein
MEQVTARLPETLTPCVAVTIRVYGNQDYFVRLADELDRLSMAPDLSQADFMLLRDLASATRGGFAECQPGGLYRQKKLNP